MASQMERMMENLKDKNYTFSRNVTLRSTTQESRFCQSQIQLPTHSIIFYQIPDQCWCWNNRKFFTIVKLAFASLKSNRIQLFTAKSEFLRGKCNCFLPWPCSLGGKMQSEVLILPSLTMCSFNHINLLLIIFSINCNAYKHVSLFPVLAPREYICQLTLSLRTHHSHWARGLSHYAEKASQNLYSSYSWDSFGLSVIIWRIFLNGHFSTIKILNS